MKRTPIPRGTSTLRRSAIGDQQRVRVQSEQQQARVLEGTSDRLGLFSLHRVDWHHVSSPMRDKGTLKAGFPDYLLLGEGWLAFLEIKARNAATGKLGKLSASQHRYHAKLKEAGVEVWTAYLPDDLGAINAWLAAKTGRQVAIDGLLEPLP